MVNIIYIAYDDTIHIMTDEITLPSAPDSAHERLREARKKIFKSAAAFARKVGVNVVTYRAHENGQNGFDADDAERYAKHLGVSPAYLLIGPRSIEMSKVATPPSASPVDAPGADMGDDQISEVIAILDVARGGKLPRQARSDLIARARQMLSLHPTGKR